MWRRIFLLTGSILLAAGCNKLSDDNIKGQITISSAFDYTHATLEGYQFELGSYISFPSPGDQDPDIIFEKFEMPDGTIKPGFNSPSNQYGFAQLENFPDLTAAVSYFNQLSEADSTYAFVPSTDTVRLYDVYLLRTRDDQYVKLLVRDIRRFRDLSQETVDVKLDFVFQPDGTPTFPD